MKENFRKEELMDQCIKYGMPVTGEEDVETLEALLNMAYEEDKLIEDIFDEDIFEVEENIKEKRSGNFSLLGKLGSLFF